MYYFSECEYKCVSVSIWCVNLLSQMKDEKRNVILLIDNAGGHNMSFECTKSLTNVVVEYLPPNTTLVLQQCDAAIIRAFKAKYRKLLISHILDIIENQGEYIPIKTKQAIMLIVKAWRQVTAETIKNCWKHTGIIKRFDGDEKLNIVKKIVEEKQKDTEAITNQFKKFN